MPSPTSSAISFHDLYVVEETIGRGSFGEVVRVRRRSDAKVLVCKVLRYGSMKEKERQLIVSEVNILRGLRHPNIVRYFDRVIDKKSSKLYIVMEYCEGGDLGKHIKRRRRDRTYFDEGKIWRALWQLLCAFEACHLHKEGNDLRPILHRDIKPCNIFLDSTGNIKVGDFGLAKELSGEDHFATTNVGTPYYMSPELINERRYNEKSDIWSIGCLTYEMAALRPPFEAMNVVSLGKKISAGKFSRIPSRYSSDLQDIIEQMLTLDPIVRPSVSQLKQHPKLMRFAEFDSPSSDKPHSRQTSTSKEDKDQAAADDLITAKLRDLKRREEDIAKREKALDIREQDLQYREKALEKREKMSLSSGSSSGSSNNSPKYKVETQYAFQSPWIENKPGRHVVTPKFSDRKMNVYIDSKRLVQGRSVEEILNSARSGSRVKRVSSTSRRDIPISISPKEKLQAQLDAMADWEGRGALQDRSNSNHSTSWTKRNPKALPRYK